MEDLVRVILPTGRRNDSLRQMQIVCYADEANTTLVDIAGNDVLIQFKKDGLGEVAWAYSTLDGTATIGGTSNATITLLKKGASLMNVEPGIYIADVQFAKPADDYRETMFEIEIRIKNDISR